ncbi:MAG TPA: rhodanese-like domain-containing protein, partial [Opitutus sp.]|nr:rhodanese-like domain-containing protein [Opitutus sp.]
MRRFLHIAALGCLALLRCGQAATITPLGVLYVGEESMIDVPFHNESPSTVSVVGAETSCECLVPQFAKTEIPAGETGLLRFAYRPTVIGRMRVVIDYLGVSVETVLARHSVVGIVAARERFLTIGQLRDILSSSDAVLVDLRRPDRFEAVRLSRSLNLPAFALKHRADLKTRKLVLIDEGFSPSVLAEQAETLRQNGFEAVYVFEGGIATWIRAGGAVEGLGGAAHAAARISPAEFLRF